MKRSPVRTSVSAIRRTGDVAEVDVAALVGGADVGAAVAVATDRDGDASTEGGVVEPPQAPPATSATARLTARRMPKMLRGYRAVGCVPRTEHQPLM